MFGLSKRELDVKFTKSELFLLAWRSREQSAALEKSMKQPGRHSASDNGDAEVPEGLPEHFFNKDGDLDLRQVSGREAYRFFSAIGKKLPIIMR